MGLNVEIPKKERRNMFSINTNRSFEMTGDECVVILLESSYSFLALAIIAISFGGNLGV